MTDVEFNDVIWIGSRFVATASAGARGLILDSDDGVTWQEQLRGRKGEYLGGLAVGPTGVLAMGSIGRRPATWTSPDGLTWTVHPKAFPAAPDGSGFDEDIVSVTDVVATDDGWLAVGRRDPACQFNCDLDPIRAYLWTSGDGAHWTRVADRKAFHGGGMEAVARGDDGYVAAGLANGHAAIWTSSDGSKWSRVPDDPIFHGPKDMWAAEVDVAERDGIIVVTTTFGSQDAARVRAWWSTDGRSWSKASVEHGRDAAVHSVTATPDGFLAVGWSVGCPGRVDPDPNRSHGAVWASTDGRVWRCDLTDTGSEGFSPWAAAASDTVEVAVGSTDPYDEDEEASPPMLGTIWYRTPDAVKRMSAPDRSKPRDRATGRHRRRRPAARPAAAGAERRRSRARPDCCSTRRTGSSSSPSWCE